MKGCAVIYIRSNFFYFLKLSMLVYVQNIMNPATFADANPLTPRTPESIRIAFDTKRQIQVTFDIVKKLYMYIIFYFFKIGS